MSAAGATILQFWSRELNDVLLTNTTSGKDKGMPICSACGSANRDLARFCWNCAAPLPFARPDAEDRRWLAATLASVESSTSTMPAATGDTAPLIERPSVFARVEENLMEEPQATPQPLFGGRYEVPESAVPGPLSVRDNQPWRHCWACGSTSNEEGEAFCINCGASLEARVYQAYLGNADQLSGPLLIASVSDPNARAVLPELVDFIEQDGQALAVLHDRGRGTVQLPLDEIAALKVGRQLAMVLATLHQQSLALGKVSASVLEVTAAGEPRLHDVPALQRITSAEAHLEAVRDDLRALAVLLEELTATPRTTQRLSEAEGELLAGEDDLSATLRELRTGTIVSADDLATRLDTLLAERTRPLPLRQIVGAATDTGVVRDYNEDSYLYLQLSLHNNATPVQWGAYFVSDGMGGHAAGEVASGLAIRGAADLLLHEYFVKNLDSMAPYDDATVRDTLRRAGLQANQYILREAQQRGNDMGATITFALVVGDRLTVANVGDSRSYLFRDGKLQRISRDHSLVMRLVELGQISEEDIYTHPQRSAVMRSLGDKAEVEVDVFSERLKSGDMLFLCSDGQWEMTRDAEMERIIAADADPHTLCRELVAQANQRGGEDNITVVLVRFER
jgi:protein phosphatase